MKISEIIGKELVSASGLVCGYVRGIYAQDGALRFLACADNDEREFTADFRDVRQAGGKLLFEKGGKEKNRCACVRPGQPAYTEDGKFLGYVKDIIAEKGVIKSYLIGGKRYPFEILSIGDAVIVRAGRVLKEDVTKDGNVILKKGTVLCDGALEAAAQAGEYVQAQLKSL